MHKMQLLAIIEMGLSRAGLLGGFTEEMPAEVLHPTDSDETGTMTVNGPNGASLTVPVTVNMSLAAEKLSADLQLTLGRQLQDFGRTNDNEQVRNEYSPDPVFQSTPAAPSGRSLQSMWEQSQGGEARYPAPQPEAPVAEASPQSAEAGRPAFTIRYTPQRAQAAETAAPATADSE